MFFFCFFLPLPYAYWMLDVCRTASYENHSCPSVRLSIWPSLNFLKIRSLVFSDILHDDS